MDWTTHSRQDKSVERSHRDRSRAQLSDEIRVLALGLDFRT